MFHPGFATPAVLGRTGLCLGHESLSASVAEKRILHKQARASRNRYNEGRIRASLAEGIRPNSASSKGAFSESTWEEAADDPKARQDSWEALRSILPYQVVRGLMKPGQYLGNEHGVVAKDWDSADVRFVLAYPDLYSIGMSSTGHIVLYSCLNEPQELLCDRAYLPFPDMQSALADADKPLFAVESKRPLGDFHVVGMSISYELTATNCLKMMELAKLPVTWKDREDASPSSRFVDGPPLVFAGGLSVTANPEPYADFFDFFALGDGENALPAIGLKIRQALRDNPDISREELLFVLATEVGGVYVPRFYDMDPLFGNVRPNREGVPARPQRQNALPEPSRAMALVPYEQAIHDRLSVEIRRGCTRGCRFCLPGMVQRPARDVDPEEVIGAVKKGVEASGYNEFSLLSLSCSDWLSLPSVGLRLKNELNEQSISLSLGSQRVDRFDENIARVQGGLRKSGVTFAPEAGSQRMRDVINKGLTDEDLLRGVRTAYDQGWHSVKLYFMIGLPGETDDDVLGIARTVKYLQKQVKARGRRRLSISLTISSFTPKPWTPFQWHSVSTSEFIRKQKMLKDAFKYTKDVKVNYTDHRLSSMEEFIGRGDRRLCRVIRRAHELGAGMDAWWESMDSAYNAWCQAIDDCGLTWKYRQTEAGEWNVMETVPEDIKGKRGWRDVAREENLDRKTLQPKTASIEEERQLSSSPLDRPLPWDHIDVGLDKGWLRDELMRALAGALTPDCAFHECSMCGVCGDDMGNNITIPPPPIPEYAGEVSPSQDRNKRIRIVYARSGALALTSHLDTLRMLDRMARRTGLPVSFDGGYHPHPRIVTAAALPYGATSTGEIVDFYLTEQLDTEQFARDVAGALPPGLSIVSTSDVPLMASPSSALLESAEFVLVLFHNVNDVDGVEVPDWDAVIEKVLASGPVMEERTNKKGRKSVRDIRKMLLSLRRATPAECAPVLEHIGIDDWPENGIAVVVSLEHTNLGALSPDGFVHLVQEVTSDQQIELLHAHRTKLVLGHDHRYDRVSKILEEEFRRHLRKPKRNAWSRIMVSLPSLNGANIFA